MIYDRGFYVGMKLFTMTEDVLDMTAPTKDHYSVSNVSLYSLQKSFFLVIYLLAPNTTSVPKKTNYTGRFFA